MQKSAPPPAPPPPPTPSPPLCRYFSSGACTQGDRCRFRHQGPSRAWADESDDDELPALPARSAPAHPQACAGDIVINCSPIFIGACEPDGIADEQDVEPDRADGHDNEHYVFDPADYSDHEPSVFSPTPSETDAWYDEMHPAEDYE